MRRDLTRGCATCRLRFSARLTNCPVCHGEALTVIVATNLVQPTSRAAWLAKWVITLSVIPAIGFVLWTGAILLRESWPPKNALDIIVYVLGGFGTALGASIAVAIPLWIWIGIVTVIRFLLGFLVDRPRRTLRVSIETEARPSVAVGRHPMHRLWEAFDEFVQERLDKPGRIAIIVACLLFVLEIIAEIFGEAKILKTSSIQDFGGSLLILVLINAMGAGVLSIFLTVLSSFLKWGHEFLAKPPHLFGYDPDPPVLQNDAFLTKCLHQREQVIGHAAALNEVECAAFEMDAPFQLKSPLSGQTCLAFRIVGETDGQPVDDGDATRFAVIGADQRRYVVTNSDVIVYLPAETKHQGDGVRNFLVARGLPATNFHLREGLLREGDRVLVAGHHSEIRTGTAGYREMERRTLLDADDGLPVLIRTAGENHS